MKPYHRNPRRITKKRYDRLTDTLARLGDLGGIVHNLETDEIIGGNQRMAVFKNGKPVVIEAYDQPDEQGTVAHGFVIWQDKKYAYRQVRWDEDTASEANIAANIGAGTWDWDALSGWDAGDLQQWGFDTETLTNWQTDIGALRTLLDAEQEPQGDDPGAQVDKAAELQAKWSTATGQMWALGEHRLVCGDCTDAAVVARVMGGEKAQFCFTDPPYNVGINYGKDTNDNQKQEDFVKWCKKWAAFLPQSFALTVGVKRLLWWGEILGDPDWVIAWVKMNGAAQSGIAGPNKWDPVLLYRVLHDKKSDVIEINNSYTEGGEHPTSKPVDLWCEVIRRFSQDAFVIYDPFLGSGTTLIACERLGRRCRAVEIDAGYVAVALERWSVMTGQTPVLLATANSAGTVQHAA